MSEQQPKASSARTGMPMGSTVAVVIAVVAVLLGLLVLKKMSDENTVAGGGQTPGTTPTKPSATTPLGGSGVVPPVDTTPKPVKSKTGSKIQVANASRVQGQGRTFRSLLAAGGYSMGTAINGNAKLAKTTVYYKPGDIKAQGVAMSVAEVLCAGSPQPMPAALPVDKPTLETGVGVLVMLGTDRANKNLTQIKTACTA